MNDSKALPFGLTYFNAHALIKINCKLTDLQYESLKTALPDAWIEKTCKGMTRIESCTPSADAHKIMSTIQLAILKSKQERLAHDIHQKAMELKYGPGFALAG